MYDQGARASQFKFNNLFNKYFPKLFLIKVCLVKAGELEVGCYSKLV